MDAPRPGGSSVGVLCSCSPRGEEDVWGCTLPGLSLTQTHPPKPPCCCLTASFVEGVLQDGGSRPEGCSRPVPPAAGQPLPSSLP